MRAQNEPLVGELASAQRADHVGRAGQPARLVDAHAHREIRSAGQAVVELHPGAPPGRGGAPGHARQDLGRRLVPDGEHGDGVQRHLRRVEALYLDVAVQGQRRNERRERVARPGKGEHRAPLDRLPVHPRAVRIGVDIGKAGIVEHDHARRSTLFGEQHLVAPEIPAVARDDDLAGHRHAHGVECQVVLAPPEVGVDHLGRHVAGPRVGVPPVEEVGMARKAVLRERGLAVRQLHGHGGDDVHLHVVGKLGQVHVVGVALDLQARALHRPGQVLADALLGLRAGGVGVCGDRAQMLAERVAAGQLQEAGLAHELRGGPGLREAGGRGLLGRGGRCGGERGRERQRDRRRESAGAVDDGTGGGGAAGMAHGRGGSGVADAVEGTGRRPRGLVAVRPARKVHQPAGVPPPPEPPDTRAIPSAFFATALGTSVGVAPPSSCSAKSRRSSTDPRW